MLKAWADHPNPQGDDLFVVAGIAFDAKAPTHSQIAPFFSRPSQILEKPKDQTRSQAQG